MFTIPGKIPLTIHPIFWVVATLIGWLNSMTILGTCIWVFVILISVIIHEFGHALTAVAFGQRARIELIGFGGATIRDGKKLKPWQDFITVFNGPLAGLSLGLIAGYFSQYPLISSSPVLHFAFLATLYANIFWTILNLLPIQPLDGGHLVKIMMQKVFGFPGLKYALFMSMILAGGFAALTFIFGHLVIGMIFMLFAFEGYREWSQARSMVEDDHDQFLHQLMAEGVADYKRGNLLAAAQKFTQVRSTVSRGVIFISATELLSAILEKEGRIGEAFQLLESQTKDLSPEGYCRLHRLAWKVEKWQLVTRLGDKSYQIEPGYEVALLNAYSYSLLGEVTPAVGWLRRAISDGLPDVPQVLSKHEFDNIRQSPEFRKI